MNHVNVFRVHRKWILEVMRDGLREECDTSILVKGPALKMIMSAFHLPSFPVDVKILIIQVRKMDII